MGKVPVKGYEGLYSVDTDGNIWSEPRENGGFKTQDTFIMTQYTHTELKKTPYKVVHLSEKGARYPKMKKVHKILAEAFVPKEEGKTVVNHIDGNSLNNSISNLEWTTVSENNKQAWASGKKKYSPPVNSAERELMRSMFLKGHKVAEIIEATGRGRQTVYDHIKDLRG